MKKFILMICLLAATCVLKAQDHYQGPPQNVQDAYRNDYPQTDPPAWHQVNGQWRADFRDRGPEDRGEMQAFYDRDGRRIDSHVPYDLRDVPQPIMDRHRVLYQSRRVYGATQIIGPDLHAVFQIRFRDGKRFRRAYYDQDGHDARYEDRH